MMPPVMELLMNRAAVGGPARWHNSDREKAEVRRSAFFLLFSSFPDRPASGLPISCSALVRTSSPLLLLAPSQTERALRRAGYLARLASTADWAHSIWSAPVTPAQVMRRRIRVHPPLLSLLMFGARAACAGRPTPLVRAGRPRSRVCGWRGGASSRMPSVPFLPTLDLCCLTPCFVPPSPASFVSRAQARAMLLYMAAAAVWPLPGRD